MKPKPNPGQIIGEKYQIIRLLGEGGMGATYLAEHVDLKRLVVLKLLHPSLQDDEELTERFKREGRILADFSHPNIVSFFHYGVEDGCPYLVMQYLEGVNLRQILQAEGRLEPERALSLISQIAAALQAVHSAGVIHRDLKPENIILVRQSDESFPALIDFGISRVEPNSELGQKLTCTGTILGSVSYMSPEQAEGRSATARSDIYSLACVLYELLAGEQPFKAESPIVLMYKHRHEKRPLLVEKLGPGATRLDEIVCKGMAQLPEKRYETMTEFKTAIDRFLFEQSESRKIGFADILNKRFFIIVACLVIVLLLSLKKFYDHGEAVKLISSGAVQSTAKAVPKMKLKHSDFEIFNSAREKFENASIIEATKLCHDGLKQTELEKNWHVQFMFLELLAQIELSQDQATEALGLEANAEKLITDGRYSPGTAEVAGSQYLEAKILTRLVKSDATNSIYNERAKQLLSLLRNESKKELPGSAVSFFDVSLLLVELLQALKLDEQATGVSNDTLNTLMRFYKPDDQFTLQCQLSLGQAEAHSNRLAAQRHFEYILSHDNKTNSRLPPRYWSEKATYQLGRLYYQVKIKDARVYLNNFLSMPCLSKLRQERYAALMLLALDAGRGKLWKAAEASLDNAFKITSPQDFPTVELDSLVYATLKDHWFHARKFDRIIRSCELILGKLGAKPENSKARIETCLDKARAEYLKSDYSKALRSYEEVLRLDGGTELLSPKEQDMIASQIASCYRGENMIQPNRASR